MSHRLWVPLFALLYLLCFPLFWKQGPRGRVALFALLGLFCFSCFTGLEPGAYLNTEQQCASDKECARVSPKLLCDPTSHQCVCKPQEQCTALCAKHSDCRKSERCCGNFCTDLLTSSEHCGQCGESCRGEERCCAGTCQDLSRDINHCGACNKKCQPHDSCCQGACTDTRKDPHHCGRCGVSCETGQVCCDGSCRDLQHNSNHCGACNKACRVGEVCCQGSCALSQASLLGHKHDVVSLSFNANGDFLLSTAANGGVRLWTPSGAPDKAFQIHTGTLQSIAFDPTGTGFVSGCSDGSILLWTWKTGTALYGFPLRNILLGHKKGVNSVAFSPDGKLIASASDDGTARLWEAQTGALLRTLTNHDDIVNAVVFSPDGKTLFSASDDNKIRLWDPKEGKLLASIDANITQGETTGGVAAMALSPDGKKLAALLRHCRQKNVIRPGQPSRYCGGVTLWEISSRKLLLKQTIRGLGGRPALAFHPQGDLLALSNTGFKVSSGEIIFFRLSTKKLTYLQGHKDRVLALAFASDGKTLYSCSEDRTLREWSLQGEQAILVQSSYSREKLTTFTLSPKGDHLLLSLGNSRFKSLRTASLPSEIGEVRFVTPLAALSPNGLTLAIRGIGGALQLWNAQKKRLLSIINDLPLSLSGYADELRFSPDSRTLLFLSEGKARLLDPASGNLLRTLVLTASSERKALASFRADSQRLALGVGGERAGAVVLWDPVQGKRLRTIPTEPDLHLVRFGPFGRLLLGSNKKLELWDPEKGTLLQTFPQDSERLYVRFTPDGKKLITATHAAIMVSPVYLKIWDVATGKCLFEKSLPAERVLERTRSVGIALSPDGAYLALASCPGGLFLLRLSDYKIVTPPGRTECTPTVAAHPTRPLFAFAYVGHSLQYLGCPANFFLAP